MRRTTLAVLHGIFNLGGGLWPLLHMPSFEAVFGRKTDVGLVRTVAGLLVANGAAQVLGARSPEGGDHAMRTGLGTAATLGTIDAVYAPTGRISRMYLLDGALEAGWLVLWVTSRRADRG